MTRTLDQYIIHSKTNRGLGIYIHIPFCTKACHYCNFYFVLSQVQKEPFIDAIICELIQKSKHYSDHVVQSIYFGGGTPSLLTEGDIHKIMQAILSNYDLSQCKEITLEANPDDINEIALFTWKSTGINRLSIGVQSFDDNDLIGMNRSHNAFQATQSIEMTARYFDHYSIDLMFGLPNMSIASWSQNLSKAIALNVPHIATYNLTVEEKTALHRKITNKQINLLSEADNAALYQLTLDILENNAYHNYEISNFGKINHWAIHNTSYWLNQPYIGIGPSAHSYDLSHRYYNISNLNKYISLINNNDKYYDNEYLTMNNKYNEYIMTRLRTIFGVDIDEISVTFGEKYYSHFISMAIIYVKNELISINNNTYHLTTKGKLIADTISSDLMYIDA